MGGEPATNFKFCSHPIGGLCSCPMNLPQILAQANPAQVPALVSGVVMLFAIVALVIAIKVGIFIIRVIFILIFLALAGGAVMHFMNAH